MAAEISKGAEAQETLMSTVAVVPAISGVVLPPVPHESFFHRVENEIKHLFGGAPTYVSMATAAITYVGPLVVTLTALFNPAAASAEYLLLTKVQSALAAANVVIKAAGPTPTIQTYLDSVKSNLGQLVAAGQIKNPESQQKAQVIVDTIISEIDAILSALPAKA